MIKLIDLKTNLLSYCTSERMKLFKKQVQEKYTTLSTAQVSSIITIVFGFIEEVDSSGPLDNNEEKIKLLIEVEKLKNGDSNSALLNTMRLAIYTKSFLALMNHPSSALSLEDYLLTNTNFPSALAKNQEAQATVSSLAKEVAELLCNANKRWLAPKTLKDITVDEMRKAASVETRLEEKRKILEKIKTVKESELTEATAPLGTPPEDGPKRKKVRIAENVNTGVQPQPSSKAPITNSSVATTESNNPVGYNTPSSKTDPNPKWVKSFTEKFQDPYQDTIKKKCPRTIC